MVVQHAVNVPAGGSSPPWGPVSVAQLVRAPDCESGRCQCESGQTPIFKCF
jgi:hypothetical protein